MSDTTKIVPVFDRVNAIVNDLKSGHEIDMITASFIENLVQGEDAKAAKLVGADAMRGPHSALKKYRRKIRDAEMIKFCLEFCSGWTEYDSANYLADELARYHCLSWARQKDIPKLISANKKLCQLHQILRADPKPLGSDRIYSILVESSLFPPPHHKKEHVCLVPRN